MRILISFAIIFMGFFSSQAVAWEWWNRHGLAPLYHLRNDSITDHFYTTSTQQRDLAQSCCGFTYVGVTAWVPVASYYDDVGLWEPVQYSASKFRRFWKGQPQQEHFYTTKHSDASYVLANGWVDEGHEGYLYSSSSFAEGLLPLYRLNKFNPSNSDLVHFYTLSVFERDSLVAQGWGYDGVEGYAYPAPAVAPSKVPGYYFNKVSKEMYVSVPSSAGGGDGFPSADEYMCAGQVEVYINGQFVKKVNDWQFYHILPGTFNSVGCASRYPIPYQFNSNTTYQVRLEFGGARGMFTLSTRNYGYPSTLYPSSRTVSLKVD